MGILLVIVRQTYKGPKVPWVKSCFPSPFLGISVYLIMTFLSFCFHDRFLLCHLLASQNELKIINLHSIVNSSSFKEPFNEFFFSFLRQALVIYPCLTSNSRLLSCLSLQGAEILGVGSEEQDARPYPYYFVSFSSRGLLASLLGSPRLSDS